MREKKEGLLDCDLILKGGITSGIVYAGAISTIAKAYRLRKIGGTSSGSIGAVMAAAAEYRRQRSTSGSDITGFEAINHIPNNLGSNLKDLLQPAPSVSRLFVAVTSAIALMNEQTAKTDSNPVDSKFTRFKRIYPKLIHFLWTVLPAYWLTSTCTLSIGLISIVAGLTRSDYGWVAFGLVVSLFGTIIAVGVHIIIDIATKLPKNNFGLCKGIRTGEDKPSAFTEWMADTIDTIAGFRDEKGEFGKTLTIGDLDKFGITLASMTTDLSTRRPYRMPLKTNEHYFSKAEFEELFPRRIVEHLTKGKAPHEKVDSTDIPSDLYKLPEEPDLPVLLVARFSIGFPGLISAIPLYRIDTTLKHRENGDQGLARCLFSDGGISSNFPIHFFDTLLPSRPTFGVSLESYDPLRHGPTRADRTFLPKRRFDGEGDLPVYPIRGILNFLGSILYSAKDWQDTLQSRLPGYAERIVRIRLDDKTEGGLNLNMSDTTVTDIANYGYDAGKLIVDDFEFDTHRVQRACSVLPAMGEVLQKLSDNYNGPPWPAEGRLTYPGVLKDKTFTLPYSRFCESHKDSFYKLATKLADVGSADYHKRTCSDINCTYMRLGSPYIESDIRLIASANRRPIDYKPDIDRHQLT